VPKNYPFSIGKNDYRHDSGMYIDCPVSRLNNRLRIRDRCYDFLNIFAEKIGEKIGVSDSKTKLDYAKILS
jgi:hypothetical protein